MNTQQLLLLLLALLFTTTLSAPIRIMHDFDRLDTRVRTYFEDELVPVVTSYLQTVIDIKNPVQGTLVWNKTVNGAPNNNCGSTVVIPQKYRTGVSNTDLVIIFNQIPTSSSDTMVAQIDCLRDTNTGRQTFATIHINEGLEFPTANSLRRQQKFENQLYTLLHEYFHVLGIHPTHVPYFKQANGTAWPTSPIKTQVYAGETYQVLSVPETMSFVRTYFNCPNLDGVPWENDQTDVNHLEKRFFYNDVMSQTKYPGQKISFFSQVMLNATGWYTLGAVVDLDYSYGNSAGCPFFNTSCPSRDLFYDGKETCTTNGEYTTSYDGRFGAVCETNAKFTAPCGVPRVVSTQDCWDIDRDTSNFGAASKALQSQGHPLMDINRPYHEVPRSFVGNLTTGTQAPPLHYCFKAQCLLTQANPALYSLQVKIGSNLRTCTSRGQKLTIPNFNGAINCPDVQQYCKWYFDELPCPRNCMGNGVCSFTSNARQYCSCYYGYTGYDCSLRSASPIWQTPYRLLKSPMEQERAIDLESSSNEASLGSLQPFIFILLNCVLIFIIVYFFVRRLAKGYAYDKCNVVEQPKVIEAI